MFKAVLGFVIWYYIISRLLNDFSRFYWLFVVFVVSHIILLFLNLPVITDPATRHYLGNNAFLGDGNDFSLSVCIVIPMCLFLILQTKSFTGKSLLIIAMMLLIIAVVGTQSRGASVALAAIMFYLWWIGRKKIVGILLIGIVGVLIVNYAPPEYFERIQTRCCIIR